MGKKVREWAAIGEYQSITSLCALAVCLIALLVLLGWTLQNNTLISLIPGSVPMNPVAALLFLACGAALFLEEPAEKNRRLVPVAAILGSATVLLAGVRQWRYLTGAPLYADRWLFAGRLNHVPFAPNRIAPDSATAFVLIGLALLAGLFPRPRRKQLLMQSLTLMLGLVTVFGLISYLFAFSQPTSAGAIDRFMPMPIPTGLAFTLLTTGLLSIQRDYGLVKRLASPLPGGTVMRYFLPGIIMAPTLLVGVALQAFYLRLVGPGVAAGLAAVAVIAVLGAMGWATAAMFDQNALARQETIAKLHFLQNDLVKARFAAEEAAKAKGQFLANMSHEIRTPLHGVLAMLDILGETPLDQRQKNYVHIAHSSADTLLSVINDILDFSKIEAGRMELNVQDFDLRAWTENTISMLAPLATAKGLDLICHIAPELPSLARGDPVRLRQVLINLINNAIKFTAAGTVAVQAALVSANENDMVVKFEVCDTGIGISPEQGRRLFTAFSQVHTGGGGTGLGLAICKQLVEMMGGAISFESQPGRSGCSLPGFCSSAKSPAGGESQSRWLSGGSCFRFTVKLGRRQSVWLDQQAIPEAIRKLQVVLMIPNAAIRAGITEPLTYWRVRVRQAETADACLQTLGEMRRAGAPADILFIDHQPDATDALELARRIHTQTELPCPAMVLLARVGAEPPPQKLRELGIVGVLNKPVRQSQLFDAIMHIVGNGTPSADTGQTQPVPAVPTASGMQLRPDLKDIPVLVAEDNAINQFVIREILQGLGVQCRVVSHGGECLEALEKEKFALVLMDCFMPVLNGFDTAREIRRREAAGNRFATPQQERATERIPIIALTANATQGDRDACLATGMDGYLTKPLDRRALIEEIERLVAPATCGEGAGAPGPTPAGNPLAAEPIDIKQLLSYCQDAAFAEDLLKKFISQGRSEIQNLHAHITAGEWDAASRAAHGIKGTAAYLFAQPLRQAARRVEELCKESRRPESVREALGVVETEMGRCLQWIEDRAKKA